MTEATPERRALGLTLMMSPPDFFDVSYAINPWMDPAQWSASAELLSKHARDGWKALRACYEGLGAEVLVLPPVSGLPDLVFTANCGLVLDRTVFLASYRHPERQPEQPHGRAFFESLKSDGYVDRLVTPPDGMHFEGAGDAIWDAHRGVLWSGFGMRSSAGIDRVLADTFGVTTIPLELRNPHFYHLDTCFCALSRGEILVHEKAFSARDLDVIRERVGAERVLVASDDDADHLGVNSVSFRDAAGRDDVVLCYASDALRGQLRERGYDVHVVDLASFNRSGGAAFCLTLRLDQTTR